MKKKNQSFQHEDLLDQITEANEEIKILKAENERIRNDLNFERKINDRTRNELKI